MRVFELKLTTSQKNLFDNWMKEQDKKVVEKQKLGGWKHDFPNYGACGGAYTYLITPTSIGVVIKVKNCVTDEIIDLSDYEDW